MKLFALGVVLCLVLTRCAKLAAVTVGLYAPDRYDGIPETCLIPMDFGYCKAKVKRYYFDVHRMKCTMFFWGGCAGNVNNFKSLDECNKVCLDAFDVDSRVEAVSSKERPISQISRNSSGFSNNNNNNGKNNSNSAFKSQKIIGKENAYNNNNYDRNN